MDLSNLPPAAACDRELVRRGGFPAFVGLAFQQLPGEQGTTFQDSWHIGCVAEHLQAQSRGQISNLAINIPPGCMKSVLVCKLWQPWEWIDNPFSRWIFASYDARLSGRDAGHALDLMRSVWFRERWGLPDGRPLLDDKSYAIHDYVNNAGGFRWSTSCPNGPVTGRHAHRIVVDDPIKPIDASRNNTATSRAAITSKQLEKVGEWFFKTMPTRLIKGGTNTIIMQRLHENDLVGKIQKQCDDYEFLVLPMRYEKKHHCSTSVGQDQRTEDGQLLFEGLFDEAKVKRLEKMLADDAESQLQQRPGKRGGTIFRAEHLRYWSTNPGTLYLDPQGNTHVCIAKPEHRGIKRQSWDMTFKDVETADDVAGGVWETHGANHFLVELFMGRLDFVSALRKFQEVCERHPDCGAKYIEDKANGTAILNTLRTLGQIQGLIAVEPKGSKLERAHSVTWLTTAGNVVLPNPDECPGVRDLVAQMLLFPRGSHDDGVDMLTQFLIEATGGAIGMAEAMLSDAFNQ